MNKDNSADIITFPAPAGERFTGHSRKRQMIGYYFSDPATVQRIIDQMLEIDKICPSVLNNVGNYVSTALETSRNMAQR